MKYDILLSFAGVAQPVEQLICNQPVGGSNPFASLRNNGQVPERSNGTGCKPVGASLRRFESFPAQERCGSSSMARAIAFQAIGCGFESRLPLLKNALVAQSAERILGKDEVISSNLIGGSVICFMKNKSNKLGGQNGKREV